MSDYLPNIPQPSDNLSNSQADLLNNFQQLNTIFNADHYAFNDATVANRGLHRQINFPEVTAADPTLTGVKGEMYTKTVNALTTPFFANATQTGAMWFGGTGGGSITTTTGSGLSNGQMTFPNGIIIKWGYATVALQNTTTIIPFSPVFPNNCFAVVATPESPTQEGFGATLAAGNTNASQFGIISAAPAGGKISFIAIGN